jgi:hypothetical protein
LKQTRFLKNEKTIRAPIKGLRMASMPFYQQRWDSIAERILLVGAQTPLAGTVHFVVHRLQDQYDLARAREDLSTCRLYIFRALSRHTCRPATIGIAWADCFQLSARILRRTGGAADASARRWPDHQHVVHRTDGPALALPDYAAAKAAIVGFEASC